MRLPLWLLCLALPSCQQQDADLTSKLLFTASGTYDAQADQRVRQGQGVRSAQWRTRPPLPATQVNVKYDSDARTLAWHLHVLNPGFQTRELTGQVQAVPTPSGEGKLFVDGRLNGVLMYTPKPRELAFMTYGYAQQHAPAFVPAFKTLR